jgi:3'(2'), 5'-bisphosphate nucleotidase
VSDLTDLAVMAARQAGIAILSVYRDPMDVKIKKDGSPLTLADQNAHQSIIAVLSASRLPMVSEECDDLHMEAQRYWLIDPLDGTKDFLASNDEFTVNIALIEQQRPVLGVVFAPALDELYVGVPGSGAWSVIACVRS